MKTLIDLDMIAHELGHLREDTGDVDEDGNAILQLADLDHISSVARGRLFSIIVGAQSGSWDGYLTRGTHYRHRLGTLLPYKGHREDAERDNVDELKQIFHLDFGGIYCDDREADDAMSTEQWQDLCAVGHEHGWEDSTLQELAGTVIATRDKDLETVPGWHFKWFLREGKDRNGQVVSDQRHATEKGEAYWISYVEALRNFYTQCLIGDTSDNIPGLYNIGPKSAWVTQLQDMVDEQEMYNHVSEKYDKYYRRYGNTFLNEVANLLHMQRRKGDWWHPPHERDDSYWYLDAKLQKQAGENQW